MAALQIIIGLHCSAQSVTFLEQDEESVRLFESERFVNPEFQQGIIVFNGGKQSSGTVNICTIDQKVYFVSPEKDTLVLKDSDLVNRVFIKGRTFIHANGSYLHILDIAGNGVCFGEVKRIELLDNVQTGAYGQKRQNAAVQTMNYIDASGYRVNLHGGTLKPFTYSRYPYLYTANGNVLPFTRKNLQKCFPGKKEFLEIYFKDNKVNINAVEPALELFRILMAD